MKYKKIADLGVGEIFKYKNFIKVIYSGNMGADVRKHVHEVLGYDLWQFKKLEEEGSPDYSYYVVFDTNTSQRTEPCWGAL